MLYFLKITAVAVSALALAGCAYEVNFDSSPRGAEVVCNGDHKGRTPLTIKFREIDPDKMDTYKTGCIMQWASGAVRNVSEIDVHTSGQTNVFVEKLDHLDSDVDKAYDVATEIYITMQDRMFEDEMRKREEREQQEEIDRITRQSEEDED